MIYHNEFLQGFIRRTKWNRFRAPIDHYALEQELKKSPEHYINIMMRENNDKQKSK